MQLTVLCAVLLMIVVFFSLLIARFMITNRGLNRSLKEARDRAKQSEQSRNDLMANLSHELRTPINTITGMSELMLQQDLGSENARNLRAIRTTGYELLSKVNDLLDYSQIVSGNISLREETYSITSVIDEVLLNYIDEIRDRELDFIVDLEPTVPAGLLGDEAKIRRVLSNVLSNAIKFTREGFILLRVSARREDYGVNLRFEVSDTGIGMNEVEISRMFEEFYQGDSSRSRSAGGIGLGLAISFCIVRTMGGFLTVSSKKNEGSRVAFTIPQRIREDRPSIVIEGAKSLHAVCYLNMEKYGNAVSRAAYEDSITHLAEGTGVSLTFCRTGKELQELSSGGDMNLLVVGYEEFLDDRVRILALCDRMPVLVYMPAGRTLEQRRNLYVIERPFYGAPVADVLNGRNNALPGLTTRKGTAFTAPGVRVLVVDDNRMNLYVARGLLGRYGLTIDTASSGSECLAMVESKQYNMIFMDHMMPEMDGAETLKRIRAKQDPYFRELPVIALTANAAENARDFFIGLGFSDFLAKPIDNLQLDRLLSKLIPRPMRVERTQESGQSIENAGSLPAETKPAPAETKSLPEVAAFVSAETGSLPENPGKAAVRGGVKPGPAGMGQEDDAPDPIDMETALGYLGDDMELFREIAEDFCSMHGELSGNLNTCLQTADWENYRIQIHALKSNSRTVGALRLGDMAEHLEKIAKRVLGGEEDAAPLTDEIKRLHPDCMKEYDRAVLILGEKCHAEEIH